MYELEVLKKSSSEQNSPYNILFVHGAYVGAWCWQEHFMDFFCSAGYDCTALSFRGHGKSQGGILNNHRLCDYVQDLETVVSESEKPIILISHSMGCMVSQKFLQQKKDASEKVIGTVYMAPIPFHGVAPSSIDISMKDPMVMLQVHLVQLFGSSFATKEFARRALFSRDIPDALLDSYRHKFQPESFNAIWDVSFLDLPIPVKNSSLPQLFIGGKKDNIFSTKAIENTASRYGEKAVFIDNTAHMMMLDPRWEKVAEKIKIWLNIYFAV